MRNVHFGLDLFVQKIPKPKNQTQGGTISRQKSRRMMSKGMSIPSKMIERQMLREV